MFWYQRLFFFDFLHLLPVQCVEPGFSHFDSLVFYTLWPLTYMLVIFFWYSFTVCGWKDNDSRKVLQDWVQQQPNLKINDLRSMFYGGVGAPAVVTN